MMQKYLLPVLQAGLLALLVATPLLGITVSDDVSATVSYHPKNVLIAVLAVMAVQWIVLLVNNNRKASTAPVVVAATGTALVPATAASVKKAHRPSGGEWQWWALAGVSLLLPAVLGSQWLSVGALVFIYAILALGMNVVVGLAGLLDLGYVAFYAIGAYAYALLSAHSGVSFWLCLPLAAVLSAGVAMLLGLPILRLRGDYFAIVTLAFAEILQIVLLNWESLSGGPNGIASIARPTLFGLELKRTASEGGQTLHEFLGIPFSNSLSLYFFYYLTLAVLALVLWYSYRLRRLPLGRAWEAMREDDIATRALGINLTGLRLSAYAIAAGIAGIAGCLFAAKQGFIEPKSFNFMETALILAAVVLGGLGNPKGIVIAAAALVLLPEVTRDIADYRMLLFGLLMVVVMIWRPQGLGSGVRQPTIRLHPEAHS